MTGEQNKPRIWAWLRQALNALVVGGLFAVALVVITTFALSFWEQEQHRQEVISAFIGDVAALRAAHEDWLPRWRKSMHLLATVDALKNAGGRRWLLPEFRQSTRLAVYEANAGNLGTLPDVLAQAVVEFYMLTRRLNAEIQVLSSPSILLSNQGETIKTIEDNDKTMESWRAAADDLLEGLRAAQAQQPGWWRFVGWLQLQ